MQRIGLALVLSVISACALAHESYERQGIGYAKTGADACSDALLYIKKQALLDAGAIISAPDADAGKPNSTSSGQTATENQLGDAFVKVVSKEEAPRRDRRGNYACIVKAKLSVDIDAVIKHNLAYKGKLPAWLVVPPSRPGKIMVIAKSKTLDGAIARTLHKYAETLAGEQERIGHIESLLDGKPYSNVRDTQINSDISVKWKRKYYVLGDKADPMFIHTFAEQTIFSCNGKVRNISAYREIQSEKGFVSNFEDESSGETAGGLHITKASAPLKMLVDSLNASGFEIRYEQAGKPKEWYVMLFGNQPSPKN